MKKLMHIIASPREEKSHTLEVSHVFLDAFKAKHPQCTIDALNLFEDEIPALTMKRVDGKYMLLSGKDLFGAAKESWQEIIQHIERFLSADYYLISTPMWNFHIPYLLKQYIDVIVQPKYLFRYTDHGVEGLAKNKKMVIIASRGGEYNSPQTHNLDFQEPYLRAIFGFVGISDITFIKAEPMDMGEKLQKEKLQQAEAAAHSLAENINA